jgi:hypothetical protein
MRRSSKAYALYLAEKLFSKRSVERALHPVFNIEEAIHGLLIRHRRPDDTSG